jgi:hypothetical protein
MTTCDGTARKIGGRIDHEEVAVAVKVHDQGHDDRESEGASASLTLTPTRYFVPNKRSPASPRPGTM